MDRNVICYLYRSFYQDTDLKFLQKQLKIFDLEAAGEINPVWQLNKLKKKKKRRRKKADDKVPAKSLRTEGNIWQYIEEFHNLHPSGKQESNCDKSENLENVNDTIYLDDFSSDEEELQTKISSETTSVEVLQKTNFESTNLSQIRMSPSPHVNDNEFRPSNLQIDRFMSLADQALVRIRSFKDGTAIKKGGEPETTKAASEQSSSNHSVCDCAQITCCLCEKKEHVGTTCTETALGKFCLPNRHTEIGNYEGPNLAISEKKELDSFEDVVIRCLICVKIGKFIFSAELNENEKFSQINPTSVHVEGFNGCSPSLRLPVKIGASVHQIIFIVNKGLLVPISLGKEAMKLFNIRVFIGETPVNK